MVKILETDDDNNECYQNVQPTYNLIRDTLNWVYSVQKFIKILYWRDFHCLQGLINVEPLIKAGRFCPSENDGCDAESTYLQIKNELNWMEIMKTKFNESSYFLGLETTLTSCYLNTSFIFFNTISQFGNLSIQCENITYQDFLQQLNIHQLSWNTLKTYRSTEILVVNIWNN